MVDELITMLISDLLLEKLDALADKFGDFTGIDVNHMIMVRFVSQLIDRMAIIEIMALYHAGRFELREHAVDRR